MSHKNRRRSINIPSERIDELRVTKNNPDLPDFYSGKSISFNAKLSSDFITSQYMTATWILLRHMSTKLFAVSCKQIVAGWADFRKLVSLNVSFPTTIGNCRTVPASPADLNVVYTVLRNIKSICC